MSLLALLLLISASKAVAPVRGMSKIDVVLCLDLSGSTNGLLDDVRDKIWEIINQVHSYRPAPEFRLGVVGFSRPSFGAKNGYVKVLQDLTSDFDLLMSELYKLKPSIEKGDQFVGEAIRSSIRNMDWNTSPEALKVIYLVGNGMVHGGNSDYREACELAVKAGVVIHTVYCQTRNNFQKELPGWREISRRSGGEQFTIRIHKRDAAILTSPELQLFRKLTGQFTATYLPYGSQGRERYNRVALVDEQAKQAGDMTFESRMFYKISDRFQFHQQTWDLVDYMKFNNTDLSEMDPVYLPDSLRHIDKVALRNQVLTAKDKRNRLLMELRRHIPFNRQALMNREMSEKQTDKSDIFDRTLINSLNLMASSRGFSTGDATLIEFRR